MARVTLDEVRSLLDAPSPAVLTVYRPDGSALVSPVWYRATDDAIEMVIAAGDGKLAHLEGDPRCVLVVFEAVPPFRGLEVRADALLSTDGVAGASLASRPATWAMIAVGGSRRSAATAAWSCACR